jgi:hypothetical protein
MPKDNNTIDISVPIWLIIVIHILSSKYIFEFSYYIIASLASFHPTGYSSLKFQTYCSLYNFLDQGCWTLIVPSQDEKCLSILLLALLIDAVASSPTFWIQNNCYCTV